MSRAARLAAVVVAFAAAVAHAGWWDDAGAARRTTLDEVRRDAGRWRDVTIVLDVQFARVADAGNPYFTRFVPKDWRSVGVFAADAAPEATRTAEPFALCFVRRGSDAEARLAETAKGRRLQLRAVVRDAVKGEPWIEVLDVVTDGDPLTPEEEAVLARGELLLSHENAAAAEPVLRGLVTKRALPKAVQAEVWRKIGAACWSLRRFADAADAWSASLAADPADRETVTKLAAAKAAAAEATKPSDPSNAASVAPSSPAPPASFGTPVAPIPRRLLPPAGMPDAPPAPAKESSDAPAAKEPPPAEEPPPPAKPKLAGPK